MRLLKAVDFTVHVGVAVAGAVVVNVVVTLLVVTGHILFSCGQ